MEGWLYVEFAQPSSGPSIPIESKSMCPQSWAHKRVKFSNDGSNKNTTNISSRISGTVYRIHIALLVV